MVEALQVNNERSRYYETMINKERERDKGEEKKEREEREESSSEQAVIVIVVSYLVINVSEVCACFRRLSSSAGQSVGSDAIAANGRVGQRERGVAAAGDCSG